MGHSLYLSFYLINTETLIVLPALYSNRKEGGHPPPKLGFGANHTPIRCKSKSESSAAHGLSGVLGR